MNKIIILSLKFIVTLGLLIWIGNRVDWNQVIVALASLGWKGWLLSLAIVSAQNILAAWRWRLILLSLGLRLPWWKCLRYFYVGLLLNQTLPASVVGDMARVWLLNRNGYALGAAVHSIILDKIFPILSLLALIALTAYQWGMLTGQTTIAEIFIVIALGFLAILSILIFISGRIVNSAKSHWVSVLQRLLMAIHFCLRHPRNLLPPLLAGILGFCCMAVLVSSIANFMFINLSILTCLVILPSVFLVMSLPISIGGWGIREGVMVIVLGYIGILPNQSIPLSIAFGLILLVGSLPGLLCLIHLNLTNFGRDIPAINKLTY